MVFKKIINDSISCQLRSILTHISGAGLDWKFMSTSLHQIRCSSMYSVYTRFSHIYCKVCLENPPRLKLSTAKSALSYSTQVKHTNVAETSFDPKNSNEKGKLLVEVSSVVDHNPQQSLYTQIVEAFPEGIQLAFAYGSGAIQQQNNSDVSKNMLDFIFVVDKPRRWHRLNLEKHPHHYSFLKYFGPDTITRIQDR